MNRSTAIHEHLVSILEREEFAPAPDPDRATVETRAFTSALRAKGTAFDIALDIDLGADDTAESPKRTSIRTNRTVDALFRNAYRAQLDMLALAATKANIMISLNGILLSILLVAGSHFMSVSVEYLVPIGILLVTSATATVFAVFAARPTINRRRFERADFDTDSARLLVFEEFADLDRDEYDASMTQMLSSRQRIYHNMIAHIHELGVMADRKYWYLYYSYTAFVGGVVLTTASFGALFMLGWFNESDLSIPDVIMP